MSKHSKTKTIKEWQEETRQVVAAMYLVYSDLGRIKPIITNDEE